MGSRGIKQATPRIQVHGDDANGDFGMVDLSISNVRDGISTPGDDAPENNKPSRCEGTCRCTSALVPLKVVSPSWLIRSAKGAEELGLRWI